jgi:hypothetical protein
MVLIVSRVYGKGKLGRATAGTLQAVVEALETTA